MRIFKAPGGAGPAACATLTLAVLVGLVGTSAASAVVLEETFKYTGAEHVFTVPVGVTSIHVVATGAAGGAASDGGTPGGRGAVVSGNLSVEPGPLYIEVGGPGGETGGFNGGGSGGTGGFGEFLSGGGGGASDVRQVSNSVPNSLLSRLVVAAAGGGGGISQEQSTPACPGGPGGDEEAPGSNGGSCGLPAAEGGGAGKANEGGAGGAESPGTGAFVFHLQGTAGTLGVGGTDAHAGETYEGNGGGGGGGLYGGGGGGGTAWFEAGAAGGGGGSNLVPAGGTSAVAALGAQPSVTITYDTSVTAGAPPAPSETGTAPPGTAPAPPSAVLSQGFAVTPPPAASVTSAAIPADVRIIGAGDTIAVHGKMAVVSITCRSAASCTGVVDLQSRAYNSGGGVVYAHTRYTIAAGKTMTVAMALGKTGRKLLSHHQHARAYLYLDPSGGLPAGTLYVGGEILLALHDRHRS